MSKFTKQQQKAIEFETNNILINAGAGSGKTTVLTQRIINKLKKGTKIDELLVLTFTKAAAEEMKERVVNAIKKEETLKHILPYVYISDITTFDSFLLKILKKYSYTIDLNTNVKIGDDILLDQMLTKVIDDVFEKNYEELEVYIESIKKYEQVKLDTLSYDFQNSNTNANWINFFKLLENYTTFNDSNLKQNIKELYNKYQTVLNKEQLNLNVKEEKILQKLNNYEQMIINKIEGLTELLKKLDKYSYDEEIAEIINTYKQKLLPIISAKSYNTIQKVTVDFKLKAITAKRAEKYDGIKEIHKEIKKVYDEIQDYIILDKTKEEILQEEVQKEDTKSFILNMLHDIDTLYLKRKKENNIFKFDDIMKLVLKILEDNENIRKTLQNTYKEILVDEYQDTNDFQNKFINLIQNDNLYLVGDVKQSIYRFRNTNPENFNNIQKLYEKQPEKGEVINLLHNFRSREEVLTNVNSIFEKLMTPSFGMIDYKNNQALEFGNKTYDLKSNEDYNMECLEYNKEEFEEFGNKYIESYIIVQDIKQKYESGYKVLKNGTLEKCNYSDFTILTRTKSDYDEYKKMFKFFNIPLTAQKEEILNDKQNYEILTLLSILKLIVNENDKLSQVSILRSFIYETPEQDIYEYIHNEQEISQSKDIKTKINLIKNLNIKNLELLLSYIYKEFNFFEHVIKLEKVSYLSNKMIKINEVAQDITKNQGDINDLIQYLEYLFETDQTKIELIQENSDSLSVKLMTIHKSKGLEFPIVYLPQLNKKVTGKNNGTIQIKNDDLILPKIENYIKHNNFLNYLADDKINEEEINESIRLLYVAMTRAKEKIIFVDSNDVSQANVMSINSFSYFRDLINPFKEIMKKVNIIVTGQDIQNYKNMIDEVNKVQNKLKTASKEQPKSNVTYIQNSNPLELKDLFISSKQIGNLLKPKEKKNIELGIEIHKYLEILDLKEVHNEQYIETFLSNIHVDYREQIKNIINNMKDYNITNQIEEFYTEYEFYYEEDNTQINGIIDLLIKTKDTVYIIDYKLKDISKVEYIAQVNTYKRVMSKYYTLPIKGFLYSLLDNTVKEV